MSIPREWLYARTCTPCQHTSADVHECAGRVWIAGSAVRCCCGREGCGAKTANDSPVIPLATDSRRTSTNAAQSNLVSLSDDSHLIRGDE